MQTNPGVRGNGAVRFIASLWLGSVVLMLVLLALACATLYESMHGTDEALAVFYKSRWFAALLGLTGISVLAAIIVRFPFPKAKIGFVITHASVLVILIGAVVTHYVGVEGQLALVEGQSSGEVRLSGAEQLRLTNRQTGAIAASELPPSVFGGFDVVEKPKNAAVSIDNVEVAVSRYLPDSDVVSTVANDGPAARRAIKIEISSDTATDSTWLFAGENSRVGGMTTAFTVAADADDLRHRLAPQAAASDSVGLLKVAVGDQTFERPVEACQSQPCSLEGTGFSIQVAEYFPHATVGQGGAITNASSEPKNPAVRVQVTGPDGSSSQLAFANFPDFRSTHDGAAADEAKLSFVASGKGGGSNVPIEVLTAPDAGLFVKFTQAGEVTSQEIQVGESFDTPWPRVKLAILKSFENARAKETLAVHPDKRDSRVPGLVLAIRRGDRTIEGWVQKGDPRTLAIGDTAYSVEYKDQSQPLGFQVALNKFTVGYYPGGRRPRSFESQITITDPATGVSSNRLVSMNHPTSAGGYTFYQSSYQLMGDRAMSVLSVSKDPGQPIVFAGHFGLMGGMLWVVITRMRAGRGAGATNGHVSRNGKRNGRTIPLVVPGDRCQSGVLPGVGADALEEAKQPGRGRSKAGAEVSN